MEEQHGFRPGRSTITCNLVFSNYVYRSFAQKSQVDVIYTDFNKAFDSVNHNALVQVLKASGIGEPLLSWLSSYLSFRYQWVKLYGVRSNVYLATSGVPQGGHLSPLLFSLFINSVSSVLSNSRILCFADDIKLFSCVSSLYDCMLLQIDFDRFTEWFNTLGLSLNVSKCKTMTFTRIRFPVKYAYHLGPTAIACSNGSVTDLGFILTCNLDPSSHIEHICCKAFKTLGFVLRLSRDFRLGLSFKILYCTLVRPILEYGAVFWNPHDNNDSVRLERVQRKFMKYAGFRLNIPCEPHNYESVATQLGLVSLAERRRLADIKFLKNLLDGIIDSPELLSLICFRVPQRPSRSVAPFYVPFASTNYLKNEPISRMMSNANVDPSCLLTL